MPRTRSLPFASARSDRAPLGPCANSGYVPAEEIEDLADLSYLLVHVERRVPGREHVQVVRMVAGGKLLDVKHGLSIGTAAVILADHEEHRCTDGVGEIDRVAVAHQFGQVARGTTEECAVVCPEERREVFIAGL